MINQSLTDKEMDALVVGKLDLNDNVTPGNYVHKLGKKNVKSIIVEVEICK